MCLTEARKACGPASHVQNTGPAELWVYLHFKVQPECQEWVLPKASGHQKLGSSWPTQHGTELGGAQAAWSESASETQPCCLNFQFSSIDAASVPHFLQAISYRLIAAPREEGLLSLCPDAGSILHGGLCRAVTASLLS